MTHWSHLLLSGAVAAGVIVLQDIVKRLCRMYLCSL